MEIRPKFPKQNLVGAPILTVGAPSLVVPSVCTEPKMSNVKPKIIIVILIGNFFLIIIFQPHLFLCSFDFDFLFGV